MRNYYDGGLKPLIQPPKRWKGGWWEQPPQAVSAARKKRNIERKSPRRRRMVAFVVTIALLIAGVGGAIALRQIWPSNTPTMGDHWQGDEDFDPQTTAETTIPRTEPGGSFRMVLAEPSGRPLTLTEIYQKNIASIVSITAIGSWGGSQGTGVVLSSDGYIVTNTHVIEGTGQVQVRLYSGERLDARLVGYDKGSDLAVLKVEADYLQPAEFADSDTLHVGDAAVAIGNPLGEELHGTMTDGIISALNRDVEVDGEQMTLIQTSAALNSGNSGGALINAWGQVVGITNMKMMSDYDTIEGLGFAIPTTTTKTIVDTLIATGKVTGDAVLGITVKAAGSGEGSVVVYRVDRSSDAYHQGVRVDDVILEANGVPITTMEDLMEAKEELQIGDTIELVVERNGERLTFTITLMDSNEL